MSGKQLCLVTMCRRMPDARFCPFSDGGDVVVVGAAAGDGAVRPSKKRSNRWVGRERVWHLSPAWGRPRGRDGHGGLQA